MKILILQGIPLMLVEPNTSARPRIGPRRSLDRDPRGTSGESENSLDKPLRRARPRYRISLRSTPSQAEPPRERRATLRKPCASVPSLPAFVHFVQRHPLLGREVLVQIGYGSRDNLLEPRLNLAMQVMRLLDGIAHDLLCSRALLLVQVKCAAKSPHGVLLNDPWIAMQPRADHLSGHGHAADTSDDNPAEKDQQKTYPDSHLLHIRTPA